MSRAVLLIDADTSPARSALGDLRGSARSAQAGVTAEARRAERERERIARDEARASQRAAAEASRERRRLERESTSAAKQAERERTSASKQEAQKRLRQEREETRERKTEADRLAREAARADKQRTQAAERESAKRTRAEDREARQRLANASRRAREFGGSVASGAANATRAVMGGAVAMHGQFQDARERRAASERTLGNAVRNAGGSRTDVASARDRVRSFVAETGMRYEDVAGALETGQGRGSALEAGAGETRGQALDRALSSIRDANAEGIDPGQYLAAQGRLGQAGLSGDALKTAMRYTMRAAQRGSVEVDQIIQQGLPGAVSLMTQRAASLGPNATAEQRQAARLQAYQESVALQEVGASTGRQAGNTANTLANLNNFLSTPRRQEMIHQNILTAERQVNTSTPEGRARAQSFRDLRTAMFEVDPTRTGGAMRMKAGFSPLEFAARLTQATGGNASAGANILAGGGHGNPQALLANMRGLIAFLGTEGGRVTEMMGGGGVTDTQINEHRADVENDSMSQITRAQEARDNALTDNTSKLKNLSDAIRDWQTRNPLESAAAGAAGNVAAGIGGTLATNAIKNTVAGAALPAILGGGGTAAGLLTTLGGTVAAASAGTIAAAAGAAGLVGGGAGTLVNRAVYSDSTSRGPGGRTTEASGQAAYTNPFTGDFYTGLITSVTQAVRDGMSSAPVNVEVPMHVMMHARAAGAPPR